jgi:hypothetical protein
MILQIKITFSARTYILSKKATYQASRYQLAPAPFVSPQFASHGSLSTTANLFLYIQELID